jgi:tetratricopeptide (TPR) repeat protein
MRKFITCVVTAFGLGSSLLGQNIHSPAEILGIMEKSPVSYSLNTLTEEIKAPDRSENLNYNDFYRAKTEDGISTLQYHLSKEVESDFEKAEKYFQNNEPALARGMYQQALAKDSTIYKAMTYIGQTYEIEKNHTKAIEWYQKAIDKNYIDYMSHWFIADAYSAIGEKDKAVDEITIAWILNRNNPRIQIAVKQIYDLKKIKLPTWTFTPQMRIDSLGENKVNIEFQTEWLGWAMVKALWRYEPGYRESMGFKEGILSTLQEKEAIVCVLSSLKKKQLKKHPELKMLRKALDEKMIDEYIFFEIYLPEYPFIAYQLTENFILSIKDYVIKVRGTK